MKKIVTVGISDYNIVREGSLITYALGSCVGICLYDPKNKIMGLSHILLPDIMMCHNDNNTKKFANTAIKEMVAKMQNMGAVRQFMTAKIAGGAQMFEKSTIRVGERNVAAVKRELAELKIPIVASDVGADYGRTMECDAESGSVYIKSISKGINTI